MFVKTFVITSATSEVGFETAKRLAKEGHRLVLLGRDVDKLSSIKKQLASVSSIEHDVHQVDYSAETCSFPDCFKDVSISGVVLITPRPSADPNPLPNTKSWEQLFRTCFTGLLELLRGMQEYLLPSAKVVIVSGITSVQYYPSLPQFAVLRQMWLAEAKALSRAWGPKGIAVNTVSLGGVFSERFSARIEREAKNTCRDKEAVIEDRVGNVPLRKYAELEDVAYNITQLLGDFANHVTGQNIVIDGGFCTAY